MPHFQVVMEERYSGRGSPAAPIGPTRSIIHRGREPDLRVVGRIKTDDSEFEFVVLVVEPL